MPHIIAYTLAPAVLTLAWCVPATNSWGWRDAFWIVGKWVWWVGPTLTTLYFASVWERVTSSSSNRYCTHEAATHDSSTRCFHCREEIGLHNAVYVCLTSLHILSCGFCGKPAECNIILNVRIKYSAQSIAELSERHWNGTVTSHFACPMVVCKCPFPWKKCTGRQFFLVYLSWVYSPTGGAVWLTSVRSELHD